MVMDESITSKLFSLIHFAKSFHLYNRYEMAKSLKSPLIYGEDFGDAQTLKKAKEDFLRHKEEYKKSDSSEQPIFDGKLDIDKKNMPYGGILAFEEETPSESRPVALTMQINASRKKLTDFLGKDYLVDISPESLFIIFPDLTFVVGINSLNETPWKQVRDELQETGFLDKDIAHLSGEAVSLDELRKKMKDTTSSDGALMDLRKKMYSLAYAINDSFQSNIKNYEN
jgi:hypothetical protein